MTDVDERLRKELSAHLDAHPSLDEHAFARRLANRRKERLRAKAFTVSGAAVLIALAAVAVTSLDLTGDRPSLPPSKPPPFEADRIQVRGGLDRIAVDRESNEVWVLSRRGQIGRLEGDGVRLGDEAVPSSQSGWRAFAAGPGGTLWVSSGRRVDRLDGSGEVAASTRLAAGGYIQHLEVGAGYVWASDASGNLFRIHPETLKHDRVAYMPEDDDDEIDTDHLGVGFGAAWVGSGLASEVVRVDADTLDTTRVAIGSPADSPGEVGGYANAVAIGNAYVWACCDDSDDLVAVDPRSLEIVDRFDFADGDEEPGGHVALAFRNERLWVAKFGRWEGRSFEGLFRIGEESGIEGPFPLPSEDVDDFAATREGLLISGFNTELSESIFYRVAYADVDDLPYPASETSEASPRGWLIILAVLGGFVILIFYLGREEPDRAEE